MAANQIQEADDTRARDLKRWPEFASAHLPPTTGKARAAVLFHARWRLASAFEELAAPGYSDTVQKGYSAAFKVFLSYTAHEQLAKAIGLSHAALPLFASQDLAADLRRHLAGFWGSISHDASPRQQVGIAEFRDGDTNDVRAVAYGLRNVVAHGPFTGSKLRSKASRAVLGELAGAILIEDEKWFDQWLDMGLIAQSL